MVVNKPFNNAYEMKRWMWNHDDVARQENTRLERTANIVKSVFIKGNVALKNRWVSSDGEAEGLTILAGNTEAQFNINAGLLNGSELRFWDVGSSNYVGFEAPALAADQIWVLPAVDGAAGTVLSTDGAGGLSWAAGGAAVPGADTQVIYNNSGALAAEAAFTYNYNTNTLTADSIRSTVDSSPDVSDGSTLGTTSLEWSDLYLADSGIIYLGADQDTTLTHIADTGILLNSTRQMQFGDSGTHIAQLTDGHLDLTADIVVDIHSAAYISGRVGINETSPGQALGIVAHAANENAFVCYVSGAQERGFRVIGTGSAIPAVTFRQEKSSPSNGSAGIFNFQITRSNFTKTTGCYMWCNLADVTAASIDAELRFNTQSAGVNNEDFIIGMAGHIAIPRDNEQLQFGAAQDAAIAYDGTNLKFWANLTGTGVFNFSDAGIRVNTGAADSDTVIHGTGGGLFYVNAGTNRIGIGIAAPNHKLQIDGAGGSSFVQFTNNAVGSATATDGLIVGQETSTNDGVVNQQENQALSLRTNDIERIRILNTGNTSLVTDGVVLSFGVNSEVTITHNHNVGLSLNEDLFIATDKRLQLGNVIDTSYGYLEFDTGTAPDELILEVTKADSNLRIKNTSRSASTAEIILETAGESDSQGGIKFEGVDWGGYSWGDAGAGNYRFVLLDENGRLRVGSTDVALNVS